MAAQIRLIAIAELFLIGPATVFLAALFLRQVQPAAQTGILVDWFTHHLVLGLYVSMFAMPLAAFVGGCAVLFRSWRSDQKFRATTLKLLAAARESWAGLLVAAVTLAAAVILFIVALHMLTE